MCIEVKYRCFCGVVVRTHRTACVASIAHPNEGNHQVQMYDMYLPREEWASRKGLCYQQGCPQNDASTLDAKLVKCPGCSTLMPQGQPPAGLDVNDAKFLDRTLWDTHSCHVEFCPFNKASMDKADEDLAAAIRLMQYGPEYPEWRPEEDERLLSLSRRGDDADLIAETMGRELADVEEHLEYLTLIAEDDE